MDDGNDLFEEINSNNNILLDIVKDLDIIKKDIQDNIIVKKIGDIINKMNSIINKNKKNFGIIQNDRAMSFNMMNKGLEELNLNAGDQEVQYDNGRYVGQIVNGIKEGKGTYYWNDGDRYEGEWKKDKKEGKGTYFWEDGDKYKGDWKNDKKNGKGIYLHSDGNRYEGDFKNDKREGKGIFYFNKSGNKYEGDWKNNKKKEKEYFITEMVIEVWVIMPKMNRLENMCSLLILEK